MKNLEGIELKNSIIENIYKALENSKNPSIDIKFILKIEGDPNWKETYTINSFGGLTFKGISFLGVKTETAIGIIVHNMYLDHFSFLDEEHKIGKTECHGHGDFWGTDTWIFYYIRYKE